MSERIRYIYQMLETDSRNLDKRKTLSDYRAAISLVKPLSEDEPDERELFRKTANIAITNELGGVSGTNIPKESLPGIVEKVRTKFALQSAQEKQKKELKAQEMKAVSTSEELAAVGEGQESAVDIFAEKTESTVDEFGFSLEEATTVEGPILPNFRFGPGELLKKKGPTEVEKPREPLYIPSVEEREYLRARRGARRSATSHQQLLARKALNAATKIFGDQKVQEKGVVGTDEKLHGSIPETQKEEVTVAPQKKRAESAPLQTEIVLTPFQSFVKTNYPHIDLDDPAWNKRLELAERVYGFPFVGPNLARKQLESKPLDTNADVS